MEGARIMNNVSEGQDVVNAVERQDIVDSAVREVSHIATLPEITVKIIQLVEDPESTAHDLHEVIANDPALSARVLKVVNSAFYALPGQIGSINRAIVLLGLNAVKNIAVAASLAKLFRGGKLGPDFSARDLWTHSIAVGAAVKVLSEKISLGLPDEAFLAGLIHDIGIMVAMQARRPKLLEVLELHAGGKTFLEAEHEVFGVDHQDFGRGLCDAWKFPGNLANVTGFHHRPLELDPDARTLTSLVHVGDILAAESGIGYTHTVSSFELDSDVLDELKLGQKTIEEVKALIPDAAEVADQLLR
jgi:HD-like signal output (HDOD) protein